MNYVGGAGEAMIIVGIVGIVGIILFLIFGLPLLRRLGERIGGGLYTPSDDSSHVMPEYGTAKARVNAGRYEEAVVEYRKVIEQFPRDIHAHIAIADIAMEQLNDLDLAERELQSAVAKAKSPPGISLATHRLADFYQNLAQDVPRAIEVMRQVEVKLPGSNEASRAEARILAMQKLVDGALVPEVPKRVAFRPTDEETLRRRRGY